MTRGPHLIDLPIIEDAARGNLGFAEAGRHIPFQPTRAFYLFDLPRNVSRGGHAHLADEQLLIRLSGVFNVHTENAKGEMAFRLDSASQGLYVPSLTWLDLQTQGVACILLVLTALPYDQADYIEDHDEFKRILDSARF